MNLLYLNYYLDCTSQLKKKKKKKFFTLQEHTIEHLQRYQNDAFTLFMLFMLMRHVGVESDLRRYHDISQKVFSMSVIAAVAETTTTTTTAAAATIRQLEIF